MLDEISTIPGFCGYDVDVTVEPSDLEVDSYSITRVGDSLNVGEDAVGGMVHYIGTQAVFGFDGSSGATYMITFVSNDGSNVSSPSSPVSFKAPGTLPPPLSLTAGKPDASGNPTVTWTPPSGVPDCGVEFFRMGIQNGKPTAVLLLQTTSGGLASGQATIAGLPAGQSTIFAEYNCGYTGNPKYAGLSPYSNDVTVTGGGAPAAPQLYQPHVNTNDPSDTPSTNEVDLAWKNSSNNETGFKIYRLDPTSDKNPAPTWQLIKTIDERDATTYADKGMLPGSYQYEVIAFNDAGMSNADPTVQTQTANAPPAATPVSVGVWPAGTLVSFDGSGLTANDDSTIEKFSVRYHSGTNPVVYQPGVGGTDSSNLGVHAASALNFMFGITQGSDIESAYFALAAQYQTAAARKNAPIDIIGYSRGCYEATILAAMVLKDGIPNLSTLHEVKTTPKKGPATDNWVYTNFQDKPTVRFLGLISPVAQDGLDPLVNLASLGFLQLNLGLPDRVPSGVEHVVEILDNQLHDPHFPQTTITATPTQMPGGPTKQFQYNHPDIGYAHAVMNYLLQKANAVNVPVDATPVPVPPGS